MGIVDDFYGTLQQNAKRHAQSLLDDPLETLAKGIRIAQGLQAADGQAIDGRLAVWGSWLQGVLQRGSSKWGVPQGYPATCQLKSCPHQAFSVCEMCGKPCCLGHVFLAADASVVCWDCVATAKTHVKKWAPPGAHSEIDQAYELLGATPADTNEDIKKRYKALVKTLHPDHVEEARKIAVTPLFRQVKAAYDRIRKHRGMT